MDDGADIEALLTELAADGESQDGLTVKEMVARTGLTAAEVNRRLHRAREAGRLIVTRKRVVALDNVPRYAPSYKITPIDKSKGKKR